MSHSYEEFISLYNFVECIHQDQWKPDCTLSLLGLEFMSLLNEVDRWGFEKSLATLTSH